MITWTTVSTTQCTLGESPVWDAEKNRIYWVDILTGTLHWFNFSNHTSHYFDVGQKIGSVALAGEDLLVAALEKGFYYLDIKQRSVTKITDAENEQESNRFNDGKCDAAGRFWAGSMSETGEERAGRLYMLDNRGSLSEKLADVGCSNGLAWSANNRTMYYIDSLRYQVAAYDFDLISGVVSNGRPILHFPAGQGMPDGMTIDVEGKLWIAMWNAGVISRFDPTSGKLLRQIKLPVSQVTSCTFGGESLLDLFVTTASVGLSLEEKAFQPLAGSLFRIQGIGCNGLSPQSFQTLDK